MGSSFPAGIGASNNSGVPMNRPSVAFLAMTCTFTKRKSAAAFMGYCHENFALRMMKR
jgi:hypothetical protein